MNVSELYNQVAQLGFEDSLESDARFYFAANRAILQVNSIRPAVSSCRINHNPMKNLLSSSAFTPVERSEDLFFVATDAKSYYFEADGNGSVYIENFLGGGEWKIIDSIPLSSHGDFVAYRGFIKADGAFVSGTVRLRFVGEYLYSVRSVAMYRHIYSDSADDIPAYLAFTPYDISALAGDFLSLESPPIREDQSLKILNQGYQIDGGRIILLPYSVSGCFKVLYRRKPRELIYESFAEDDMTEIDLDPELCSLLPILMASYLWLEDEPSMAQYYLALYRERAADIERRGDDLSSVTVKSTNGW